MSFYFPMMCLLCALTLEACAFIFYLRMQRPRVSEFGRASLRRCRNQIIAGFACIALCGSTLLCFHRWKCGDDAFAKLAMEVGFATVCERLEESTCTSSVKPHRLRKLIPVAAMYMLMRVMVLMLHCKLMIRAMRARGCRSILGR